MSKTVDELAKTFRAGLFAHLGANPYATVHEGDRAGVTAVVRALRDEIASQFGFNERWNVGALAGAFDEILGDAGEKAEGVTDSNASPSAELCEDCPRTGHSTDETRCTTCPRRKPADPAPAVCEWADVGDKYRSACGRSHFAWTFRDGVVVCPYCKAPIKFTEAKT